MAEHKRSRSRLGSYHRRFRLRSVRGITGLWALAFAIMFIAGASYPIPEYVWAIPLLLSLYLGSMVGYRICKYALSSGRYGVESIWKTRILMTFGLLATGVLLFLFLVSATLVTFTVPYSTSASYQQALSLWTNFIYTVFTFLGPVFFGFGGGEAYLLYRLRHHYTLDFTR
jgi:uncharacterized membrane protein